MRPPIAAPAFLAGAWRWRADRSTARKEAAVDRPAGRSGPAPPTLGGRRGLLFGKQSVHKKSRRSFLRAAAVA